MQKLGEHGTHQDAFQQGIEVLRYFRSQMIVLSDERTLVLLDSVRSDPFTNRDAREFLGVERQASWKRLAQLADSGLVQKRGHSYRVAPFAREFVSALSSTMAGVMTGKPLVQATSASKETLECALEGLEALYAKGRLSQADYSRHRSVVEEMIRVIR